MADVAKWTREEAIGMAMGWLGDMVDSAPSRADLEAAIGGPLPEGKSFKLELKIEYREVEKMRAIVAIYRKSAKS